jgi:ribosomal protein S18 acetylase RimI-like enzyme
VNDIHIRTANVDDRYALGRVLVDATYHAFRGVAPDESVESLTVEESAENWARALRENQDAVFLVAEVAGLDVVGLAMVGSVRSDKLTVTQVPEGVVSELYSLQVDPAWHRRGIGRMLVERARTLYRKGGSTGMLIKVLSVNPNVAFYEALGARLIGSEPYDWEGFATEELVYAWTD